MDRMILGDMVSLDVQQIFNVWTDDEDPGDLENVIASDEIIHFTVSTKDTMTQEEVCDSTQQVFLTQEPTGSLPSIEDYPGLYDFSIVPNNPPSRSSWEYSSSLKQVFIDMQKVLLMKFQLSSEASNLFIRALPVYSSSDHFSTPVMRCVVHSLEDDPHGKAHSGNTCECPQYNLAGHVIRSLQPDAKYLYNPESRRHSVMVPVGKLQAGANHTVIPYMFFCKTSCPHGMHRRPISIIFTLETSWHEVIGRRVLDVKICSCPKRDKFKMELDYEDAQPSTSSSDRTPSKNWSRKRIKIESSDDQDPLDVGEEFVTQLQKSISEVKKMTKAMQTKIKYMEGLLKKLKPTL